MRCVDCLSLGRVRRVFSVLFVMLFVSVWLSLGSFAEATTALSDKMYAQGKIAYKGKYYDKAAYFLKQSVSKNPKQSKAWFYLGLTYSHLKKTESARASFESAVQVEEGKRLLRQPYDLVLIQKARRNMAVLVKKQIVTQSGSAKAARIVNKHAGKTDNYLTYALGSGGKVIRWNLTKMPLRVYVEDGFGISGWRPTMNNVVDEAIRTWTTASHNLIRFRKTTDRSQADIVVHWEKKFKAHTVGLSPLKVYKNTILQSDVHLSVKHAASNKALSYEVIQATAIHEFGHALGIRNHSPFPTDAMFYSQNYTQGRRLSARDERTIRLLYQEKADVSNNTKVSTAQANKVFQLLQQSNSYIVSDPARAISILSQAARIDPNHIDVKYGLGLAYYNQGVAAARQRNRVLARERFGRAIRLLRVVVRDKGAPAETQTHLAAAQRSYQALSR